MLGFRDNRSLGGRSDFHFSFRIKATWNLNPIKNIPGIVLLTLIASACSEVSRESVYETWENNNPKVVRRFHNPYDTSEYELREYFQSGELRRSTSYKHGAKDGWQIGYFKNGAESEKSFFQNNTAKFEYVRFHENNEIAEVGNYGMDGLKTGPWKEWDSRGKLRYEAHFSYGEEVDYTVWYDSLGCTTRFIQYYEDGPMKIMGHFKNCRQHGLFKEFDNKGALRHLSEYENGKLLGNHTFFYPNGRRRMQYILGKTAKDTLTINMWNEEGHQVVKNGNGEFTEYLKCPITREDNTRITRLYMDSVVVKKTKIMINRCPNS